MRTLFLCGFPLLAALIAGDALAIETSARQAIVLDDDTGTVLLEKNADEEMHPSSMSKLMTVYLVFSRLKDGSLHLADTLPVSEKAWRTQGSKTFVELGGRLAIDELLKGIIIQSGNDACVVVAEGLAGSEEAFAGQMNDTAKKLGLTNSHFTNATGLPDPAHLMSARDLAALSHHIIHDFPEYYHYFSEREFVHHGIRQGNRNLLLYKALGVDGLKTGHTDEGGFGIAVSGKDKIGRRILLVVNGLPNEKARAEEAERLLAYGLRDFEDVTLARKGEIAARADVWYGAERTVPLTVEADFAVTVPKGARGRLRRTLVYEGPIPAPVVEGQKVGELSVTMPSTGGHWSAPLIAAEPVAQVQGFARVWRNLCHYLLRQ